MKDKLTKNLLLKILSLVVAFIFWLVIINMADPTITRKFYNVPVEVLNENVITSVNQVYEVVDGDKVDVVVKGKKSIVDKIVDSELKATADLSKLSKVNAVSIDVNLDSKKANASSVDLTWGNAVLKVSLEKKVTRRFKVGYKTDGELNEKYVLGDVLITPNIIEVSGGKSKVNVIDNVYVNVPLNGQSQNFKKKLPPILYDADGQVISSDNVSFDAESLDTEVSVLPVKSVPVKVNIKGTPAKGYRVSQADYKPETIRICGPEEEVERIKEIPVAFDITGKNKTVEKEVDVYDYINQKIRIVDDYSTISIRCIIEKEGKRTLTITPKDVNVVNMSDNMKFSFVAPKDKYDVNVYGQEKNLKKLKNTDLGSFIDLNGLHVGVYNLPLQYKLANNLSVKPKITIRVKLEDSNSDTTTISTPAPTE